MTINERIRNVLRALSTSLHSGARAALFRRVDTNVVTSSPEQLIIVVIFTFTIGLLLNRSFYSGEVVFNWNELRARWFEVPVFLLVGWIIARLTQYRIGSLTIAIVLFSAMFTVDVILVTFIHTVKNTLPQEQVNPIWVAAYYASYVWVVLLAAVLTRRTIELGRRQVLLAISPLIVLGGYDIYVPPRPMWYQFPATTNEQVSSAKEESPATEEMLYLQPRLTEQTLKTLLPRKPGTPNVYFVGFAPYGYQDVFLKESEVIQKLMDERFRTRGRSMLLVNNNKSLRRYPLATVTNLQTTLSHIGKLINKEDDVLVLYLTSHGSEDHRLSADYWPLELEELNPVSLKQALDRAGIKWRVIIVSACYSGGFIEPLRGPSALIMTAADAKHTSFGCGAESDFTYFAKAVFDEQLRETYSFEEAFQRAMPIIQQREKAEREEFSNPQIAVGEQIRAKLREIERGLVAQTSVSSKSK